MRTEFHWPLRYSFSRLKLAYPWRCGRNERLAEYFINETPKAKDESTFNKSNSTTFSVPF